MSPQRLSHLPIQERLPGRSRRFRGITGTPGARTRLLPLAVFIMLLLICVTSAWSMRTPAPRPVSAPATQFSAERAMSLLGGIASVPHPTGSPAQAAVRAYLMQQLRALGLEPEVQSRTTQRTSASGRAWMASVSNIHARISGRDPTGRVLVMAHYDSVPTGPGASDNGANVAAVLELVRALRTGPQLRNDVDILFTDAEEAGLLGAQALVDSGIAGDPRRVVAVNLEARGVTGPAVMFQAVGDGLIPAIHAAGAVTTSLASAVYGFLPNDTDLTALADGGMRGLNFAFMGGSAHYHTPHDDIAHLDGGSVQSIGDAALAVVRRLSGADLTSSGTDATYFSALGLVVSYPAWLDLPLAALLLASWIALIWLGRRYEIRRRPVFASFGSFALALAAVALTGAGGWLLLTLLDPSSGTGVGDVYRATPLVIAEAAIGLAILVAWYQWIRRRARADEVMLGVLGWFVVLGVTLAALLPGSAYLFTWPALTGIAALTVAVRHTLPSAPLRAIAATAAAVPGAVLILPVALLLLPALGLRLSAAPLLLGALLAAVTLGLMEPRPPRRWIATGLVVLVLTGVVLSVARIAEVGYDDGHPRAVSLAYLWEADRSTATWISSARREQPQVGALLSAETVELTERVPPLGGENLYSGPAPAATTITAPDARILSTTGTAGERTARIRIEVPADTYTLDVYLDATQRSVLEATVGTVPITSRPNTTLGAAPWRWGFRYVAPPRKGIELSLRASGSQPLRIRLVSTVPGLPGGVGAPMLRPDVSWTGWPDLPAQTVAVRTFEI